MKTFLKFTLRCSSIYISSILLCGCETWTMPAHSEKKDTGLRKQMPEETSPRMSYLEHKTNRWVRSKINILTGPHEPLLAMSKRRFEHATCHDSLSKTILQGTLEGGRRRGRQRKCWMNNIKKSVDIPRPCPCQNCLQGPPAEKSGRRSLLNCPSCPSDDPMGQGTGLN